MINLPYLNVSEYLTPLREGGSLPGLVRADDGQLYALKFVGAGQGPKALIAELIAGELARALGFKMPVLAVIDLSVEIARAEPHEEVHDLLMASASRPNLGLRFVPQATMFNQLLGFDNPEFAANLIWFDAFISNVDRTPKNVNMLVKDGDLWLIDHGAALYFHHSWDNDYCRQAESRFPLIKSHVMVPFAGDIAAADARLKPFLSPALFEAIVAKIPDAWLVGEPFFETPTAHRAAYVTYLTHRLAHSANFVEEAIGVAQSI